MTTLNTTSNKTLFDSLNIESLATVSAPKFERRMLNLKGIKLPSKSAILPAYSVEGRPPVIIPNPLLDRLDNCMDMFGEQDEPDMFSSAMDDILLGVVRSFDISKGHKGNKLNVSTLRNMLNKLPELSQQAIMVNYGYNRQHASKYMQACKLVIKFYVRFSLHSLREYIE